MACLLPPLRASSSLARFVHIFTRRAIPVGSPVLRHAYCFSTLIREVSLTNSPPVVTIPDTSRRNQPSPQPPAHHSLFPQSKPASPQTVKSRPRLRASKAAITLTPEAVKRLHGLVKGPTPQLIRIGVRNKGCAGMSYHLEYVEEPGKFDEIVEQDGVRVLIDSKALFSIIGSEMDWQEDKLSSKFAFRNPNVKDACGCGESFTI
ncbi:hypothetical protein K439DRAFT_1616281 [Ramaria rubella]|nr:hypothetical protein K439DRAFT_1616281 [Ramaria rubella]